MNTKMNNVHLAQLREGFEAAYPHYAKRLKSAKTESEFRREHGQILKEVTENAKDYLSLEEGVAGCPAISLTPAQYASMISATGDSIQVQVTAMLKTAQIIKPDWDVEQAAAQFIMGGLTGITQKGVDKFNSDIEKGTEMPESVMAGISEVGVAGIVAVVALIIVAIIVPIIYFMLKPASCIAVVLNETKNTLNWKDDYSVHGKPVVRTESIPPSVAFREDKYTACGIVQTDKSDGALVGSQYGFTYSSDDGVTSFGVECPLSSTYVDNNCYCAVGSTSQSVAELTDENNALSWSAQQSAPNLNASIQCASPSGYVAYYIARVQDGSL